MCWWMSGELGRPEPYYFWFYFVALNAPWILVPARELLSLPPPHCLVNDLTFYIYLL